MGFFKTASVTVLGSWQGDDFSSRKASINKTASWFLQQAGSIDVEGILNDVADYYQISKNPKDYIFVPVRANSIGVPNENGDAFSREETLRFDHKIGRRVYQTYLAKPHHVNHRADNPRMARGVIVDVHYNNHNPMPPEWRRKYEAATGTELPIDEFNETLLAVDTKKDPLLAQGIRTGATPAVSMGCECDSTKCSICGRVASTKAQFCPHIKQSKNRWVNTPSGKRKAFEWCNGVIYGELSSVDQPADPRAFRGKSDDVFHLHANVKLSPAEYIKVLAWAKVNEPTMPTSVAKLVSRIIQG